MTIYISEQDAARAGLVKGKKPKKAAKDARPELPRAEAGEGDRIKQIERIARFGYGPRWTNGLNFFWNPRTGARTTAHASYAAACIAAERELRG